MRRVLLLALPRADHEEVGAHTTPKFFLSHSQMVTSSHRQACTHTESFSHVSDMYSNGHILTPPGMYSHRVILTRIRYVLHMRHTLEHIDIYHQDGSTHLRNFSRCGTVGNSFYRPQHTNEHCSHCTSHDSNGGLSSVGRPHISSYLDYTLPSDPASD